MKADKSILPRNLKHKKANPPSQAKPDNFHDLLADVRRAKDCESLLTRDDINDIITKLNENRQRIEHILILYMDNENHEYHYKGLCLTSGRCLKSGASAPKVRRFR
jgi:hypothetical protein